MSALTRRSALALMMTSVLALPALSPAQLLASDAVQLALKFREGQVLKYTYTETFMYTPPIKFVGSSSYELQAKVDYRLNVARVTSDQAASVKLSFERIALFKDGKPICDLTFFPKQVEGISGTIKPNGETTWYKNVYITINKAQKLEFRVGTGGAPIATGTLSTQGSEKNQLEADLDEGEGVIKLGVPPTRTLEKSEFAKLAEFKIDLTPRKLFELLLLPTLPLSEGQTFSSSVKNLAAQKLLFKGQVEDGGRMGNAVTIDITPWTEGTSDELNGLLPVVNGQLSYMIDTMGKLVYAKGNLKSEILIPEVGAQVGESRIELVLKK
ncbi:MAG: hypothetical protein ACKO6N_13665 [Myxococcota bacterium]